MLRRNRKARTRGGEKGPEQTGTWLQEHILQKEKASRRHEDSSESESTDSDSSGENDNLERNDGIQFVGDGFDAYGLDGRDR
jgi:hypothetical protein